ncbi:alpha/beta fold hydrolase [Candidatus Saganbacteria bacterium]|nr:alpha/beta fold hydrolase [Candidatus Saganbacteria bacterium]
MDISRIPSARRFLLRGTALAGNAAYRAASLVWGLQIRKAVNLHPNSFVPSPDSVEAQSLHRIGPMLQHVIKEMTGAEIQIAEIRRVLIEGAKKGLLHNFGERVFINEHRAGDLLAALKVDVGREAEFKDLARKHYLLRDYFLGEQAGGYFASNLRELPRGYYSDRSYAVPTRDGKTLKFQRVINQDRVKTNDGSPSILLLPGIACNHRIFNLSDSDSLAMDLADLKNWVYLFDPRGLGENKGAFDPHCFIDTIARNDLPAVCEFISKRPNPQKPVILIGHSMGGLIAEFMLVRRAYKLQEVLSKIVLPGENSFNIRGKARPEIERYLDNVESICERDGLDHDLPALIAEAREHLSVLRSVKGLITLGSPKIFDKNSHPLYPLLLMLNIIMPLLGQEEVPVDIVKQLVRVFPQISLGARLLINAENFDDPNGFLAKFIKDGCDSFPLGVGLQFLKAIYSGKSVRGMGKSKYDYAMNIDLLPVDIPIYQIVGADDVLCPPFALSFIDPQMNDNKNLNLSAYPQYSHAEKRVYRISKRGDIPAIGPNPNRAMGFVVDGVGHIDLLFGKRYEELIKPLLMRLVATI